MQLSRWYDREINSERVFFELTKAQADALFEFLLEQRENEYTARTLTLPGIYNHYSRDGRQDSAKSVVTIGIV